MFNEALAAGGILNRGGRKGLPGGPDHGGRGLLLLRRAVLPQSKPYTLESQPGFRVWVLRHHGGRGLLLLR